MLYDKIGGLQNRTPVEVVDALLEAGNRRVLISRALSFLLRERTSLEGFVPKGKGASLGHGTNRSSLLIAEILVRVKMRHFWVEIGSRFPDSDRIWPEPCAGFLEFYREFRAFGELHATDEMPVELGILSSGHDTFITRCFEVWGVPCPDLLVTDDLMRSSACRHMAPENRNKPAIGPFEMLQREWKRKFEGELEVSRSLYVGDSVKSDGGLALNLGIPFVWFNPAKQAVSGFGGDILCISDWRELEPLLHPWTIERMKDGVSLTRIMKEVF
jgi:FMN phosphatase YigB (HAD superfamily)